MQIEQVGGKLKDSLVRGRTDFALRLKFLRNCVDGIHGSRNVALRY